MIKDWMISAILLFLSFTTIEGQRASVQYYICQGQSFNISCADIAPALESAVFLMKSVTIFAHTDPLIASKEINGSCLSNTDRSECARTAKINDVGLSNDYLYLVEWFSAACNGRTRCSGSVQKWYELIGENAGCPNGTNWFHKVLIDMSCQAGAAPPTQTFPPETSSKTAPNVELTTSIGHVTFRYHQPDLSNIEKIILAVSIGVACIILLCLFILIYCCDKLRRERLKNRLLKSLGAPTARDNVGNHDFEDPDFGNEGAVREISGAKPFEYIDQDIAEKDNQLYSTLGGPTTLGRQVQVESGYNTPCITPPPPPLPDYESEENLELERRMAGNYHSEDQLEGVTNY